MKVRFWGVRGSIPTPLAAEAIEAKICRAIENLPPGFPTGDREAVRAYVRALSPLERGSAGGNTPCVEVQAGDELIIIDAGSGIRSLGLELLKGPFGRGQGTLHLLLSHPHWDHIQGFPFFVPAFIRGNRIVIYGVHDLRTVFVDQQRSLNFPVPLSYMSAGIEFVQLTPGEPFQIGALSLNSHLNAHPGDAYSFRISDGQSVFVYASDAEYKNLSPPALQPTINFFRDADLLVFDAQYSLRESWQKIDWGHSSAMIGADLARAAGVRMMALFHHDPTYDDDQLLEMSAKAVAYQEQDPSRLACEVVVAYEGLTLDLTPPPVVGLDLLEQGAAVLRPAQLLDERGIAQIERHFATLEQGTSTIVDLAQVELLTTTGLSALVALAAGTTTRQVALVAPSPSVWQVIELAGYSDTFAVYKTVEAALAAARLRDELSLPGHVIKGRFRIDHLLQVARGGMWLRATDLTIGAPLVLHVLGPSFGEATVERLFQMAARLMELDHPAIAPILALERAGELAFVATVWVEGPSLAELFAGGERFTISEGLIIAWKLVVALEYLHRRGVVHGALAPGDIVLGKGGPVLYDVGWGRLEEGRDLREVPPIALAGGCLAPEQISGFPLDVQVDLYALGVILYRIFTGTPFCSGDQREMLMAHLEQHPRPPRELNRAISPALEHLILKLLAKNPSDRYTDAAQVLRVLEGVAAGVPGLHEVETLVGRDEELKLLLDGWERARRGRGGLALLSGEVGIGKSRLAHELVVRSGAPIVLMGGCLEQPRSLAYAPFATALRSYLESRPPELSDPEVRVWLAPLVRIIPELSELVPGLAPPPALRPRQEQLLLLYNISRLIGRATSRQPWLLLLEDLHLADEGTLELLRHLGRRLPEMALYLVVTYRDTNLERDHPLRRLLRDLARYPGYRQVTLSRLDLAGVRELLAGLWHRPVPDELAQPVYEQSGGNPLYTIEIGHGLADDGLVKPGNLQAALPAAKDLILPANVRDAIWRRVRRLPPDTQTLLRHAVSLGASFTLAHLGALSKMDEWRMLELMDAAFDRLLLREEHGGRLISFCQNEVYTVIYNDLGPPRRRLLHHLAGEAIEQQDGAAAAVILAYHFVEAGEEIRALPYILAAAAQAEKIYANQAAIGWYRQALAILDQYDQEADEQHKIIRFEALEGLGRVLYADGKTAEALTAFRTGLDLAEMSGDQRRIARFLVDVGELTGRQNRPVAALFLDRAITLLRALGDEDVLALALIRRMVTVTPDEIKNGTAEALSEDCLTFLSQRGDQALLADGLLSMGQSLASRGERARARAYYEQSLLIFYRLGNRLQATACLNSLCLLSAAEGDHLSALRLAEEALVVARAAGDIQGVALALQHLGTMLFDLNEREAAVDRYDEALRLNYDLGDQQGVAAVLEGLGRLALSQGQAEHALKLTAAAAALRNRIHAPVEANSLELFAQIRTQVCATLGEEATLTAEAIGRAMSLEQAVTFALQREEPVA